MKRFGFAAVILGGLALAPLTALLLPDIVAPLFGFTLLATGAASVLMWALSNFDWHPDAGESVLLDHAMRRPTPAESGALLARFKAFVARARSHAEFVGDGFHPDQYRADIA